MEKVNHGKPDAENFAKRNTLIGQMNCDFDRKFLLEKAYLKGGLDVVEKLLKFVEDDETLTRDDILATLHLLHMDQNNDLHKSFGLGEEIKGVEHYTEKYLGSLENPIIFQ